MLAKAAGCVDGTDFTDSGRNLHALVLGRATPVTGEGPVLDPMGIHGKHGVGLVGRERQVGRAAQPCNGSSFPRGLQL